MSYEKFIHNYFDGDLTEPEKEALFAQISKDQTLRAEFDNQLKIHLITQADMSSIVPPVDVGNQIFKKLGIPLTADKIANRNMFGNKINPIIRFVPIILSILFTFIFTVAILKYSESFSNFMLGSKKNDSNPITFNDSFSNGNLSNEGTNVNQSMSFEGNDKFTNSDLNRAYIQGDEIVSQKVSRKSRKTHLANQENFIQESIDNDTKQSEFSHLVSIDSKFNIPINNNLKDLNLRKYDFRNINKIHLNDINSDNVNIINMRDIFENRLEIKLRQLALNNTVKFDKEIDDKLSRKINSTLPEGYALAIYYRIDENQSFGIEVGNERYPQIFELANTGKYYQNPNIFWVGLGYKFELPQLNIADLLYPYAQFEACYTTIGPIVRPQIGLVFKPIHDFSVFAGYEAAVLFYNVSGTILNSGKYGFIYGLSFHF